MQVVKIIEQILAEKESRNAHPAQVTFREIHERYDGCMGQMITELNLAITECQIIEGRTINDKYYKLWQEETSSSATSTEQSPL